MRAHKNLHIFLLVFIFFFTTNSAAFAVDVRFGIFTDTHTFYEPIRFPDKHENAENKLVPVLEKFKSVNQSVGLPFVIHLGDFYENHTGPGTPAANINYGEGYLDRYSCRLLSSDCFNIYMAMGNHDSNMLNSGVDRSLIGLNLSNYYRSDDPAFARYDYDWVSNGYRFVIIDSSQNGTSVGGLITEETLMWLKNTLVDAANSGQPVLIFLHHRIDDADGKLGGVSDVPMWSEQAHNVRHVINNSGSNVLGVFLGHNHINDSRSSEEITGWPDTPENNWYKVPLEIEPSRGELVTEDGLMLPRGTGARSCSGTGLAGTWDWAGGIFCYRPHSGIPSDHQVDVFGALDDYTVNYYSIKSSSGSTALSPTKGDESGAIVEVSGTDKEGVVVHGFAEMANYHTTYSAYIEANGKDKWDPDTYSSGSLYDPFPTITSADSKMSSSDKPVTFLVQSGRIRETGVIYPKAGTSDAPRIWTCESGALITNATDVSQRTWSGPDVNGWYTLPLANVGTVSEDDVLVPRFSGYASSQNPSTAPQWDMEGTTLYYHPSSGMPSNHLVEAGTESTILMLIGSREYISFMGPCGFYGARYRGISFNPDRYNNVSLDGIITERNGEAGVYISGATFGNSTLKNLTSKSNGNYGFSIVGNTNPALNNVLAYQNGTAGLYAHSSFTGTGASLTVQNATFADNGTGIYLAGTGDTGAGAYMLDNIIVDSNKNYGIKVTAASATGAMTHSFINESFGDNIWGPLDHSENIIQGTDPLFTDSSGHNFTLDYTSGCIDSGKIIPGLSEDIIGNSIYGTPDIGAYEYQPLFTIGTDEIDLSGNIRIYADGKFRNTSLIASTTADFSIIPQGGFASGDHSEWMDIVINIWNTSENYQKIWTEKAAIGETTISHYIGDLEPYKYYSITVNGVLSDSSNVYGTDCNKSRICLSDNQGRIAFDYSGPHSNLIFQVDEVPPAYDGDSDGFTVYDDCDDSDALINPEAIEICDGIDNNCDGLTDEGVTRTYYADADTDSYGHPLNTTQSCTQPSGYVTNSTDCDDSNGAVNSGEYEVSLSDSACTDGLDNDCDGATDAADTDCIVQKEITINLWEDNHQAPVLTTFTNPGLLNNNNGLWDEFDYIWRHFPSILAGHNEWELNGLRPMHFLADNIATGRYDVWANLYTGSHTRYFYGFTEAEALSNTYWVDNIFGAGGADQHDEYLLGAISITGGRFDLWAGDGDTLSGSPYFYGWAWIRLVPAGTLDVTYYCDKDGDTYISDSISGICLGYSCVPLTCESVPGNDCNDNDAIINPATLWYIDSDNDGFGSPSTFSQQCNIPTEYVLDNNDCDDGNPLINPLTHWYPDFDDDTYGNPSISMQQCIQPTDYIPDNTDCDDSDPDIYPGGPPIRGTRLMTYYYTFQSAFDNAVDEDIIQSQDVELTENLILNSGFSITLESGYNCSFTSHIGATTLHGNIDIQSGTLSIEDGLLQIQQ